MGSYIQQIIDEDTGEIIMEGRIDKHCVYSKKINKIIVDKMIEDAQNNKGIDINMLYAWCKSTGDINDYGQIKLLGAWHDNNIWKEMLQDIVITGYTMRIIDITHNFSGIVMKNRQTPVKTWNELWESIQCSKRTTQQKIKKFLENNNLIREMRIYNKNKLLEKRLILNPFLIRQAQHASQLAIICFNDFIKENVNINSYPVKWLIALGYINSYKD